MKKLKTKITEENDQSQITVAAADIRKWVKKGAIDKELGAFITRSHEGSSNTNKKTPKSDITIEGWESWCKKNITPMKKESEKYVEFINFVISHKDELLKILADEEKTFRQSRELIDNKLNVGYLEKKQLDLFDNIENPNLFDHNKQLESETIINKLDLSPAEDRLIHTISLLLSKKSERYDQASPNYYMGNYEPGITSINSIEVETARILISPHELYVNYLGRKDYNTDHVRFILETLNDLSKKNFLITLNIPSKKTKGKKKSFDKLRTFLPIFQIAILNQDLTESESQEIDKNELLVEGKRCLFLFKFGPLFTNNIRDRYVEFPEDIHLRIAHSKASGAKGRIPQCVNLMRDLLFREKQQKRYSIQRDEETLVHTVGLSKEWKAGKKGRVLERLNKSFDIFKEIGLVENVKKTIGSRGQTKYHIKINPNFK